MEQVKRNVEENKTGVKRECVTRPAPRRGGKNLVYCKCQYTNTTY